MRFSCWLLAGTFCLCLADRGTARSPQYSQAAPRSAVLHESTRALQEPGPLRPIAPAVTVWTTPRYSILNGPHGHGPEPVYGFGVPTYRWGWFGAHYYPRKSYHHGYYGRYSERGYRQGY